MPRGMVCGEGILEENPSGGTPVRATRDNEKCPVAQPLPPRWCLTPKGIILVPCSVLGTKQVV